MLPVSFVKLYDLCVGGVSDRVEEPSGRSSVLLADVLGLVGL